jgi:sulfhydrogenase subunit beta (sulfur reductase)
MAKVIYASQIEELAESLLKDARVVAPIEKHHHSGASRIVFANFEKGQKIAFNYPTTVLPPKEFLLPPNDVILEFAEGAATNPKPTKTILFGLSFEDLDGINRLKKVFKTPISDEVFKKRAEATLVIAVDKFSPPKDIPFDLYLKRVTTQKYLAFAGTKSGQNILKNPLFKYERQASPKVSKGADPLLENKLLSRAIQKSKGGKIWDELSKKCFACGICSYVCPMCYCFETEDQTTLPTKNPPTGKRLRTWSTCFSQDFAKTAGHNFRTDRKDRIYNWYHHKFVRMPKEQGFVGCVDCNRCVVFCPAKINYRQVLTDVINEYLEKNPNEK